MTQVEMGELIVQVNEQLKSYEKRLDRLEKTVDNINSLTISVERMSVILQTQVEEQKKTNIRLNNIENEPKNTLNHIKYQVITAIVSVLITLLFAK